MFDRIIGELIEDTPAVGEIDRHLGERDRRDQAGAPRGLSALPSSVAQPGRVRPWLLPRRRQPSCISITARTTPRCSNCHWLVIELAPSRRDLFSAPRSSRRAVLISTEASVHLVPTVPRRMP